MFSLSFRLTPSLLVQGKLLAGVAARVQIFTWATREDGVRELVPETSHAGHIAALYVQPLGDYVLVGARLLGVPIPPIGNASASALFICCCQ